MAAGRPPGSKNTKANELKNAIIASFGRVGGIKYLEEQAIANPVAYMGLIGKVIPKEVEMEVRQSAIEQIAQGVIEHESLADCEQIEG